MVRSGRVSGEGWMYGFVRGGCVSRVGWVCEW